jgi:hypothetical protein
MRACFLGQTVCALGYGIATLQLPPPSENGSAKTQSLGAVEDQSVPPPKIDVSDLAPADAKNRH